MDEEEVILLKPLISRSPTMFQGGIEIPALEKILVDIYSDTKQFIQYSGEELQNIYRNANKMFHLNLNRLLYYAGRRGKRTEIMNQIKMFADDSLIKILNDNK
jgi:predicted P-loop ATPase/GTPase